MKKAKRASRNNFNNIFYLTRYTPNTITSKAINRKNYERDPTFTVRTVLEPQRVILLTARLSAGGTARLSAGGPPPTVRRSGPHVAAILGSVDLHNQS